MAHGQRERREVSGNGYDLTVTRIGEWYAVTGHVGDCDVDSEWCGVTIASEEEFDALILEVMRDGLGRDLCGGRSSGRPPLV